LFDQQAAATPPRTRFLRNAVILGLLTAIGPLAIDMYLPSLPSIGASLGADAGSVLMSMTAFFVTFAIGQLIFGPVSDMVGRKPPLYCGIALFAAASIGCALATDVQTLILFRAVQGLGGAAGIVIPRAIVRDLHSGVDEARLLSLLMLVFSVSPLLAPLIGSQVVALASWRWVFWLVTAVALLGLGLLAVSVRETRLHALRADSSVAGMLDACRTLLLDGNFVGLSLIGAFALAGFFVFLANSSFILMRHYHLSSTEYSLVFSGNAAAFFFATQLNGWLAARFGLSAIVRPAIAGYAAAMALMFALSQSGVDNLFVLGALLFIGNGFLGLLLPVTSVLALAEHGPIAGTAASLMSTLQLAVGSAVMAASGVFANGTVGPMVDGIAASGSVAVLIGVLTLRRGRELRVAMPPGE
jgi:DHA1 family bicyclomycin/chloramphenicol resistance-like MFS transporter